MNKKGWRRPRLIAYFMVFVVLCGTYVQWTLRKPLPIIAPVAGLTTLRSSPAAARLSWPAAGQAAVGIVSTPIMTVHGTQTTAPIASAAKLITALTILADKPLKPGEQGPLVTLGAKDVAIYNAYVAQHGSVVPVAAGEQISQYQMLQAIMLPSANNMADSLAIWAYGSLPGYTQAANSHLAKLGLKDTRVGSDASGLAPDTTSTAHDLVVLGEAAMQNPVLAGIVGQTTASGLPIVNTVKNVNFLLGGDNIIGIKTGNTDEAGGVFVSASRVQINKKPVTIVTAVVGQPSLFAALRNSQTLIRSAQANFQPAHIKAAGIPVRDYALPWGGQVAAAATQDLTITTWAGSAVTAYAASRPISASATAGQTVGSISPETSIIYDRQSIPVRLTGSVTRPSVWWRLTHPF